MGQQILLIILGIVLIIIAIKLVKKVTKLIFFILLLGGIYSFSQGLINIGTIMEWWSSISLF